MFIRKAQFLLVYLASLTDGHGKSKELAASRFTEGRPQIQINLGTCQVNWRQSCGEHWLSRKELMGGNLTRITTFEIGL